MIMSIVVEKIRAALDILPYGMFGEYQNSYYAIIKKQPIMPADKVSTNSINV